MNEGYMSDNNIRELAVSYRNAIETAKQDNLFNCKMPFCDFPSDCCGDASLLLAEYLNNFGIATLIGSFVRDNETHAWLILKNHRVSKFKEIIPEEISTLISNYGPNQSLKVNQVEYYTSDSTRDGLIIDITGDQFDDCYTPVYVGYMDSFHDSFEFRQVSDYNGLPNDLNKIYEDILQYVNTEFVLPQNTGQN